MTFHRQRIAVVGVGIMGSAIARRLLECGHAVSVFDPDKAKVQALQAQGAHAAPTAADAAAASDFVITSLNAAAVVERALFGENGVADAPADAQRLVIDMSSIDPPSTRRLAQTLRERTGMGFVDAPLSGGAPKALLGQLTVMAGGSVEDVTRARAVMDSLCANYTHMGESGAGQTTKLVNQLLCAIGFQAVAEAVRIAEAGGVDASKLPAALAGGRADSQILREFGPKMAARDYTPTGRIDNMLKDLEAVQGFAQGQRLPLPLAGIVSELHRTFVAAGLGPEDTAAMMRQFDGYARG
ncbi:NAD(P)-dependent oxidoreductase [Variovorax paradoxus]|jgi:2-hydroxy-3-oxopropionate reductase|uniref:NAD(P)-dependent oxidoreductase n=1 Tax=Variovorax paradoxus TaxID=34073 RepID=UPI001D7B9D8E|nr:NAD(P)-dependent oxidoreductase [Variovorax paradoxus]MBW8716698.1 NAD(P)-dependent oxidoreductase [Variovorax paradoxus]